MRKMIGMMVALLLTAPALAAQWNVDPATSRLMFEAEQSGEKFQGSFPKFTSEINFDEALPQQGKITITVDMSHVQVDGSDRMEALPTDEWFSVKQFPLASFTATSIRATGSDKSGINNYEAKGLLTIRGATRNVTLPFSLKTIGQSTTARGELTLSRRDFGIGQGRWASDEWIKYPVKVTFELHASKQ